MTTKVCGECQKTFSKVSNLRAHVKRKHPNKIDVLAPKLNRVSGAFICLECKRRFSNLSNLRAHIKGKHPGKINLLAPKTNGASEAFACLECKRSYSNVSNLRAHIKNKHPGKVNVLAPKTKGASGTFVCLECKGTFVNSSSLRLHTKRKHLDKLHHLFVKRKQSQYKCKNCNSQFATLRQLATHKKTHINKLVKPLKCPLCPHKERTHGAMIVHYKSRHSIRIVTETKEFESLEAFQFWKSELEKETFASFVNMHGTKQTSKCKRIRYDCHRSGEIRRRGQNIRQIKTQGSNKIGGYCPAKISLVVENNKFSVKFTTSHVGHKQQEDLEHMFRSKSDRQRVASKIAAKIPFQSTLDDIRDSVSNNCQIERIHLLTKKDLFNIEKSFNLNKSSMRHMNDAVSVEAWVNKLERAGSILFYKPQQCISEEYPALKYEDFLLIIMTDRQRELLSKFGDDCICADSTHGLNGYGFELHTILVLDDLREGYPCAFFISNRNDTEALNIFFSCVRDSTDKRIKPRIFMSDMAEAYYNAWVQVMYPAEYRLFCTWHVDRDWRNNLEKISDKEKKILVYRMLRILLQELDVFTFNKLLENFLQFCEETRETLDFGKYFREFYVGKVEQWAYCYRLHSGLNTNMHVERMHRTLKHLYLNSKFVKRLDKAISAIMNFVRDRIFERLIVVYEGKVCTKLSDLQHRHKKSVTLDLNKVVQSDGSWLVPSASSNEIYIVEEVQSLCTCKLMCNECSACIHQYSCSCLDCSINWNMCKHIHLVCRFIQQCPPSTDKEAEDILSGSDHLISEINEKDQESLKLLASISTPHPMLQRDGSKLIDEKQKILQIIQENLAKVDSLEEIESIKKIIAPIRPTLEAIKNKKLLDMPLVPSVKYTSVNKNIQPQRRLFSTKKKETMPKPSRDECDTLALQLIYKD